jgi:NADH:ubiquinone oxidoreductase subunit K
VQSELIYYSQGVIYLLLFIFLQVCFLGDILMLFIVLDLALSIFAVLFSLYGLIYFNYQPLVFFYVLLTLAACETAISLGFLVSFSRRFKNNQIVLNNLRMSVI